MAKEIDMQKRKDNPEFKGAFHEKKFAKTILTKNISDIAYKKAKDKEKKDKIRNSKSTRGKSGGRKKS